jgi:hypothetical protein
MNCNLTWDDQVSKICRNVFFTRKRLWTISHFTPLQTRHKLVTNLIVNKSTARLRERLKVAFNSCARYIFRISRFEHISQYTNKYWGYCWISTTVTGVAAPTSMNKIILSGGPQYLFDELQFGHSSWFQHDCTSIFVLCSGYNLVE